MVAAVGWEPEPIFGDALVGSGGMDEPVQPNLFAGSTAAEVFPDALSGVLVARSTDVAVLPPTGVVPAPAAPRPVPSRGLVPWRGPVPSRGPAAQSARYRPPPPAPWSQLPPPGQPAATPTAAPSSRRPTIAYGPAPGTPPANVSLIRPAAYLPQSAGIAQVRAVLQQARQSTASRSRKTVAATRRTGSGVWGVLVALLIVLIVTGAAEKIITAISHLLQGS